jgi:hypothetical protein
VFGKQKELFTAKSHLSKTGAALLGLSILLILISFVKGIQVLMFVPAFVLALFVYSYFDVKRVKNALDFALEAKKERIVVRIIFRIPVDFCFFGILFSNTERAELLPVGEGLSVTMPATNGKVFLAIHGKLNIFRAFLPLPDFTEAFKNRKEQQINQMEEVYFLLRPLQDGDDTKRIDAKQSAKRGEWYVKETQTEFFPLRGVQQERHRRFQIYGSSPIHRRGNPYWGMQMEWWMIATIILAAHWEWTNWLFTLPAALSALFVYYWNTKGLPVLGKHFMNLAALFLFFLSVYEGFITADPVVSGTHFLILLAIWKHFFKRERRDAFTYIFLALFVFVALSLYTLSAWFFLLFFAYLLQAIAIFVFFSSGERPEEYQKTFGRPITKKSYIRMNAIILAVTLVLFFVLPHGNRVKQTDLIEKKNTTQTGFSETVGLNDIKRIKEDYSKKFLIVNADFTEKDLYRNLYWRGVRFTDFSDGKWTQPEIRKNFFAPLIDNISTDLWEVKYFNEGEKNLFTPFAPASVFGDNVMHPQNDPSLLYFRKAPYKTVNIELGFVVDENGDLTDARASDPPQIKPIPADIQNTFSRFWDSIPTEITEDPAALDVYIREQAGFTYSLSDPARNLNDFLYGSRRGHCELFASVLAITLQHFGYPATFVNGYAGGEFNDSLGHWIIRGVNAHSWVEVHTSKGWYILDPTPASGSQSVFWYQDIQWTQALIRAYDIIELKWFELFVSYTGDRQKELLRTLWRNKHIVFPLFITLFPLFRYRRRILFPMIDYAKKTPPERFLWWLRRRIPADSFLLESLRENHSDLVQKTQKAIYGKSIHKPNLKALKVEWKKALKKKI